MRQKKDELQTDIVVTIHFQITETHGQTLQRVDIVVETEQSQVQQVEVLSVGQGSFIGQIIAQSVVDKIQDEHFAPGML
jgi:hypothetical protein